MLDVNYWFLNEYQRLFYWIKKTIWNFYRAINWRWFTINSAFKITRKNYFLNLCDILEHFGHYYI